MVEIKGVRGSGKTTTLLYLAKGSGAAIVEPTHELTDLAKYNAKRLGLTNVTIISMHEFLDPSASIRYKNKKFLIDELDMFLVNLNVEGYTKTG